MVVDCTTVPERAPEARREDVTERTTRSRGRRPGGATGLGLLLLAGVLGCSSGSGGAATPTSVASTEPVATTEVPLVSVPEPTALPSQPVDDRVEAVLTMPSPSWLTADDDAVYVRRDDGVVSRVDPATDEVTDLAEIPGPLCQGIGVGFGAVWTCSGPDVVAVDLDDGEVGAPIPVGKAAVQGHLGVGHGRVWVLVGDGSQLVGIDPETREPDEPIDLGVRGTDVAVADDAVWVASAVDDSVVRVDPTTAEVDLTVGGLGGASALAFTDGTAWVAGSSGTFALDAESGELGAVVGGGAGADGAVAADDTSVWVRRADTFLREVDADEAEAVADISADVTSGGDVIVAFGSLWVTAYDDAVLYRLSRG